ncbi:FAD-dependent oxidoreductase [Kocuria tytonis]|uniref:FAD-dependent oxidoreductase n=1 Tax=Kocuria tytonis TaxID=2054280 RepID=A0A495ACJ3_9MICC|nr:FAD-dependent oxidoreductase [Kocuria tytonis]RKQ36415.1 FAD-dependent oxidoreductase [Kocuria tytonis]
MTEDAQTVDPLDSPVHEAIWAKIPDALPLYTELVVAGGGISGCAAAISAARLGVQVVMVESTHMLGGQAGPGGVSAMDETRYYANIIQEFGFWGEFTTRVRHFYTYRLERPCNTSQYRDESFSPNPVVVDRVLTAMLKEAGVRAYRNVTVTGVRVNGEQAQLDTTSGGIAGRCLVDATEDGSVTRLSGLAHRVGNSVYDGKTYSHENFQDTFIQDITQTAMIRRYDAGTMPEGLRLTEEPEGYQKARAAVSRAYPRGSRQGIEEKENGFAGYRGAPDLGTENYYTGSQWKDITRTSLNYFNDQPTEASYLLDESARASIERAAINRTLAIIYYLQNECDLPWSVATDEGYDKMPRERSPKVTEGLPMNVVRHFPPIPYIRESVRIVGRETLTGKDIYRTSNRGAPKVDVTSIATGTYPPDLHGGRRERDLEEDLGESLADKPKVWREGPFSIPLGCLLPRTRVPMVAAEKNVSASRIGAAALRLHPTVAGIGQAAGVVSALAIRHKVFPHDVPTLAVQLTLMQQGAYLPPRRVEELTTAHEDFVEAQTAVLYQVLPMELNPSEGCAPTTRVNLNRATRIGTAIREEYESWLIDPSVHP